MDVTIARGCVLILVQDRVWVRALVHARTLVQECVVLENIKNKGGKKDVSNNASIIRTNYEKF